MQSELDPLTEDHFRATYDFEPEKKKSVRAKIRESCRCTKETPLNIFPIARWLPEYKIKENLVGDIAAGLTVAIMHIPHGLAYSQLGGVPAVVGLYMAAFPILVYVVMGTSRHISLGTFAVICAMVGQVVARAQDGGASHPTIEIASAVCLIVGLWQVLFAILRLGALTVYMSNALVSGFTTGASIHVFTYQLKNLLGVKIGRYGGPFKLIYIYYDLGSALPETNFVTLGVSLSFLTFLLVFYYAVKPAILRRYPKLRLPMPIELLCVMLGIIISYFLDLNKEYDVDIVGEVPTGLPMPSFPPVDLIPNIIVPCFPIAIVAISMNLSLAKMFSKKSDYAISGRQEVLAYGALNVAGAFFQCMPMAASLSRSILQYKSGGKTQLASVVSVTIIVTMLLFAGPVFEPVPYAVLSSIVVVSILGLILQILDLPRLCRQSWLDGFVWIVTFLSAVFIDIDYGLLVGFVASIGTLLFLNHFPQVLALGHPPQNPQLYMSVNHFKAAETISSVVIVGIVGGLNFSNNEMVLEKVLRQVGDGTVNPYEKYAGAVILDLSGVTYVDPSAANGLLSTWKELKKRRLRLFLSGCNVRVYDDLERAGFFKEFSPLHAFAAVHDAVVYATKVDTGLPQN